MLSPRAVPALLLTASALTLGIAAGAGAEAYPVTRTDDPLPGPCLPADCSLREALTASNESATVDDLVQVPAAAEHYAVELGALPASDEVEVRGDGADRVVLDAGGKSVVFQINSSGVILAGLRITGGQGGIQNNGGLTLRRVSVDHNERLDGGGGGIQSNGPLVVDSSFIGFNSTNGTAGGAIQSNELLSVTNSTIAWNTSLGPGGIMANDDTTLTSSALLFNHRNEGSGAGGIGGSGPVTLVDSILAGNGDPVGVVNCTTASPPISKGGNVEDVASCGLGGGDRSDSDLALGTLDLHGGTTLVYDLLPGSAAIDFAGSCPSIDQRGAPRPQGPACDSGPFESEAAAAAAQDLSVSLRIGARKVRLGRRGTARVRLTCPLEEQSPPCRGTLRLMTRAKLRFHRKSIRVLLARATFQLGAGVSRRVPLQLTPAKAELVRNHPAARRALAVARVLDAAGNSAIVRRRLALAPARPR